MPRLLVVDDNELNRDMLSRRLRRHGYEADVAVDGASALEAIAAHDYDLVLLDIEMPGLSGLDVLARLRTDHSADDLPVVVFSARDGSDSVVAALTVGANDYVTKPVDLPVALARIEVQLGRRQRTAARRRVDALCPLPNRMGFADWWDVRARSGRVGAVIAVNLDRFRIVNHAVGFEVGDAVIVAVGRRLEALMPEGGIVARVGGDEYVCAVDGPAAERATEIADRLLASFAQPLAIDGQDLTVSASLGVVVDRSGRRADAVLQDVDTALYRAKSLSGGRCERFDPMMRSRAVARLTLETELQQALAAGAFTLKYQPIVSLDRRELVGFEALVRWRHPVRGEVGPTEFISVAEETNLIVPLGAFVLREACEQAALWQRTSPRARPPTMAVNVSARQLREPGFGDMVDRTLASTRLNPRLLKIEITESTLMENGPEVRRALDRLRAAGIEISLDDFGTGYSSLSYLQQFVPGTLKVDRSFVNGLTTASRNVEIVRAVIKVARSLGVQVVAEGIESEEQFELLRQLGCDFGQGFLFSLPLDAASATSHDRSSTEHHLDAYARRAVGG